MTLLRWNASQGVYVIYCSERKRCEDAGLTLATKARGPNGETVWQTTESYAALEFFSDADGPAKDRLSLMKQDYDNSFALDGPDDFPTPPGLSLMPYQRGGVQYALSKTNSLIGDAPGLGKTIQAITIANAINAKRVLIVCPATIRLNWKRELVKWSTYRDILGRPMHANNVQVITQSKQGLLEHVPFVIVSYELTRNETLHQLLFDEEWDLMIIDEAHMLKQPDAERTRSLFGGGRGQFANTPIAQRCKRIVALTGTPLPNRPRECYTLAQALCFESVDWLSYDKFTMRFNPSAMPDTGARLERQGRLMELQARIRCNFMVRRQKEEVLKDLPDKRYEFAYVEPNGRIVDVLRRERMLDFNYEDLKDPMSELYGMIATLRREMGEAKVPRIVEHVKMLLDIEELPKLVLFAHHRSVMDSLKMELQGYGFVEVRGGQSTTAKQRSIDEFVNNIRCRIFCGQMDAAGFGIDGLQKVCNNVVIAEPAWTPGTNEQAIDRCHRIGQHDNVVAQFLIVAGSLDERVLAKVLDKVQTIHATLDARIKS